jgi:hypothetical protein
VQGDSHVPFGRKRGSQHDATGGKNADNFGALEDSNVAASDKHAPIRTGKRMWRGLKRMTES